MGLEGIPFSELLLDVVDNRGRTCPTADAGIRLIATNCIRNELLYPTYDNARFVSHDTYSTWFRGHPKPGDILFVNKATPGRVCLVPDPVDFCIAQDMVAVRADPTKVYAKYLFAALRSQVVQEQITQMHVGTLIPHFKKGDFDKLLIPIPSRDDQRFIGDTYFSLSAKIELNRKMNETLEAMARALFKSWFVDFDPVRAKAEGRDSGLPKHLADVFPARLVDSELGEIPEEWTAVPLYDLATYINGAAYAAFEPNDERRGQPIIKIAELKAGVTAQTKFSDVAMSEKYRVATGDILFSWSGNPDTSIDTFVWSHGPAWLNQHIFRVVPRQRCGRAFMLSTLKALRPVFAEIARNKQTTGLGHVTSADMKRLLLARPDAAVMRAWELVAGPLHERAFQNQIQSHRLSALRDALLPRLLSGELRVRDVEALVEGT